MNIIEAIEIEHVNITGWCSWNKALTLVSMVMAIRPEISLEIGVWAGKSSLPVAMAHKHIKKGKVICVDPWMAKDSVEGQINVADQKWWSDQQMHDKIYKLFMDNRQRLALQEQVQVERKSSNDFDPPNNIGLLMIDGNHGEQVLKDVDKYAPKVKMGGFVLLDDIGWSTGSVNKAVEELVSKGFAELYRVTDGSTWAVFQRL